MLNILKESLNIIIHNTLTLFKPKREKKFVLEYLENTGTLKTVFKEGKKSKDSDFEDL